MAEREKKKEENPYNLSTEKRTYPRGGGREWLDPIIALQREGVDVRNFPPQNLFDLPKHLKERWRGQAWNYYRSAQPKEVQEAIKRHRTSYP